MAMPSIFIPYAPPSTLKAIGHHQNMSWMAYVTITYSYLLDIQEIHGFLLSCEVSAELVARPSHGILCPACSKIM